MKHIFALALTLILAGTMAFAQVQQPVVTDFTSILTGLDGKPLMTGDTKAPTGLTLGDVCVQALETPLEEDKQMDGSKKFALDQLARKIYHNKAATLSLEDLTLLKQRVGKAYGPLVVGAAWRLLDPSTN